MRYIGGKFNLLADIENIITASAQNVNTIIDIFSGSGVVSSFLKARNYNVIGNDFLYFSYVLGRGTTALNHVPTFDNLGIDDPIKYLNELRLEDTDLSLDDCFIYRHYSPNECSGRMYFQNENAIKIDIIRITIENWHNSRRINDDEYFYLLASLIAAVPYISNIAGVYGAYLKHWDARTFHTLTLKAPEIIENGGTAVFYNENCDTLLPSPHAEGDLLYADPPYNARQYLPNYHILETIALYDRPAIHGVTGLRDYPNQKSDFCTVKGVESAFRRMIENARVRYILISYNNEGLLSTERLTAICREYAYPDSFKFQEVDYRRYNNAGTTPRSVTEQFYFFEKQENFTCHMTNLPSIT